MLPTAQKELVKKLTDEWASGNGPRMSGNRRVLRALEAAYEVFKSKTPSIGEERRALSQAQAQKSGYSTNEAGRAPADAEAARVSVLSKLRAAADPRTRLCLAWISSVSEQGRHSQGTALLSAPNG